MPARPLIALAALLLAAACAGPMPPAGSPRALADSAAQAEWDARARSFVEVASRVEPVAEAECRRVDPRRNCDFRIVVDDRPGMPPNAFQTLDDTGRPLLAFTLSLLAVVENPDEIAFVMAHEAGHHIAGHLQRQQLNAAAGAAVFGEIAGGHAGATPASIQRAQMLGAEVGARRFSHEFELEADAIGTVVAALAGYDPLRGAEFLLRLPEPTNRFVATHPPNAERLALVRRTAAALGLGP